MRKIPDWFLKGVQMGAGFSMALVAIWSAVAFGAAAWWSLPNAGTTLSSAAWNDIVSQLNTLAGAMSVSGGKIGIGKTAPLNALDVGDGTSMNPTAQIWANSASSSAGFIASAGAGKIAFVDFTENDGTSLDPGRPSSNFKANVYWDGANEFLGINGFGSSKNTVINAVSGNVGIGKTAPDAKLDVNGELIRSVFYAELPQISNPTYPAATWTNISGWNFTYTKKSATSKLLITTNAVVRWNGAISTGGWGILWYNINGTNYDFWGNYTNTSDMHVSNMFRRAISWIPKGTVTLQGTFWQQNAGTVCIWCYWTPNVTVEEIY